MLFRLCPPRFMVTVSPAYSPFFFLCQYRPPERFLVLPFILIPQYVSFKRLRIGCLPYCQTRLIYASRQQVPLLRDWVLVVPPPPTANAIIYFLFPLILYSGSPSAPAFLSPPYSEPRAFLPASSGVYVTFFPPFFLPDPLSLFPP